jgi:hypothetical protein
MNNGDAIFKTLTGDDWKRGLAQARATPNDISEKIKLLPPKLIELAKEECEIRLNQPRITSEQAYQQCKLIELLASQACT